MSYRSCKRLVIASFLLLSIFGLLLNVTNDQDKLVGGSTKQPDNNSIIWLNSTPYKKYCVVYDFWKSNNDLQSNSITLVLHSTLKYLHFLEKHAEQWTGPISVAIFVPQPHVDAYHSIISSSQHLNILFSFLDKLKQKLGKKNAVSVHLFFENEKNKECKKVRHVFRQIAWNQTMIQAMPNFFSVYPINVARNVARHRLNNRLFLSGDIEQLFSANYERKVAGLARELQLVKKNKKLILIHRRFEFEAKSAPKTKKQLKELYDKGKVVQFHENYYPNGHAVPDLKEWFKVKESNDSTSIYMLLDYKNPEYEPQFVGDRKLIPFHDESFPFRHRSNTHLCALLCRAGFQFAILNDVFSVHEGIKTSETGVEKAAKKLAIKNGYLQTVEQFKQSLDQRYPKTKNQCPEFLA